MDVALVYSPALGAYDLGPAHPFRPERFALAVALMEEYGLIGGGLTLAEPRPATREELLRVHEEAYVEVVEEASAPHRDWWRERRGIGPGDTPDFPGMHDAAALAAGATVQALDAVLAGTFTRSLAPAGGLHHAHPGRAAGFCIYNDIAVAIAGALERDPSVRVAYVDTDAHHGDGVQEVFYNEPRVLTISVHEDGRYLYPGTGLVRERGGTDAPGSAVNVPMPPMATDECYRFVTEEVVAPALRTFGPNVIVSQNGADAHWSDPLTSLGQTLPGYRWLYARIAALADELCGGRLVATGGGGYSWATVVPRAWTLLAASLVTTELPEPLPQAWRERVRSLGFDPPAGLTEDPGPPIDEGRHAAALEETRRMVERLRAAW